MFIFSASYQERKNKARFNLSVRGYSCNRGGIKRYQKERGLPTTGCLDPLTINSLLSE